MAHRWITEIPPPTLCPACNRAERIKLQQVIDRRGVIALQWLCTGCKHVWTLPRGAIAAAQMR